MIADEGAPLNVFGTVPETVRVFGGASGDRSITVIESRLSEPGALFASPSFALTIRSGESDVTNGIEVSLVVMVEQPKQSKMGVATKILNILCVFIQAVLRGNSPIVRYWRTSLVGPEADGRSPVRTLLFFTFNALH